jgi:predicted ATPase
VALETCLQAEPHLRLRYFCAPHHQESAFHPIIAQLKRAAGFERDDAPATRLDKLAGLVTAAASSEEDLPLLAELLSLPSSERHPLLELTPQRKKEKTFEALLRQLTSLPRQQPVLIVFEDLQ